MRSDCKRRDFKKIINIRSRRLWGCCYWRISASWKNWLYHHSKFERFQEIEKYDIYSKGDAGRRNLMESEKAGGQTTAQGER